MKRLLAGVIVAGLLGVLVIGLMQVTQNKHTTDRHDGTSTITLSVSTKRGFAPELAATSLWAACQTTVLSNRLVSLTPAGGDFALAIQPALGEHAERRLVGCLEDATIDLVSAHVVSITS